MIFSLLVHGNEPVLSVIQWTAGIALGWIVLSILYGIRNPSGDFLGVSSSIKRMFKRVLIGLEIVMAIEIAYFLYHAVTIS